MKKKIFIVINFLLIISLIIFEYKYQNKLTSFDMKISEFVWSFRSPLLTDIMKFITFLASTKFIIIILVIYIIIKRDILFPLNMSIITIINQVMKRIIKRQRPSNYLVKEKNYSFPSGHSMASCAFYGYIIYKIYNSTYNKYFKIISIIICVLIILLIGLSRIYLGVHYFSDVICGYLISIEHLIVFISVTKK